MRILVVEDEPKVAQAVRAGLEAEQFQVSVATTGPGGLEQARSERFDLIVLDLMLPGMSGLEVLRELRRAGNQALVLVLTARDDVDDRVRGLDSGADDYLVKPFAFTELTSRIRALLRRGRPEQALKLRVADLELDLLARRTERAGQVLHLTARETELLEYLLRHAGSTVSREMLARDVWQEPVRDSAIDNLIDVHVARLRRKIDDPFPRKLLRTVRGVGFALTEGA